MSQWSEDEDRVLREAYSAAPIADIAATLGRTSASVRNRIYRLGITNKRFWSDNEKAQVAAAYAAAGSGKLDLYDLAKTLSRSRFEVCRIAADMGLTNLSRQKTENGPKDRRIFKGDEEALRKHKSDSQRERLARNGHPRGMAGKTHSPETRQKISDISAERWRSMSDDERLEWAQKSIAGRAKVGFSPPQVARASWRAGWREIGDRSFYFRSRWEANYAHYLEWLRCRGEIIEWDYEPKTFWFETIKRGVCSYKPDFLVREKNGSYAWHEVKGWMDARSKTALSRMAKYYPNETVIVIDGPAYRSIRRSVLGVIPGWEDAKRDSRA
jgi:hypothetical protein